MSPCTANESALGPLGEADPTALVQEVVVVPPSPSSSEVVFSHPNLPGSNVVWAIPYGDLKLEAQIGQGSYMAQEENES